MSKIKIKNSTVTINNFENKEGKFCSKCDAFKSFAGFGKNSKSKDRLHSQCKECCNKASKTFREKNPEYMGKWREENRERYNGYFREYNKDETFKLANILRSRLNNAIKSQGAVKSNETLDLLGIPVDLFMIWYRLSKRHLVPKDYEGMTDHDHFYPLSKFDLTNPEELKKVMHWSNIRCMTSSDNRKKSNKPPTTLDKFKMLVLKYYFVKQILEPYKRLQEEENSEDEYESDESESESESESEEEDDYYIKGRRLYWMF